MNSADIYVYASNAAFHEIQAITIGLSYYAYVTNLHVLRENLSPFSPTYTHTVERCEFDVWLSFIKKFR